MPVAQPFRAILAFILAGFGALAVGPVVAAELSSTYTATDGKACRKTPGHVPDEHETVTVRCPGRGGLTVTLVYPGTSVTVAFEAKGANAPPEWQIGAGYGVGGKIEWRGVRTGAGFKPEAAIVRLQSRNDQGAIASVLAVMRIKGTAACPVAWLDVAATPSANEAARRIADGAATAFRCGADKPRIEGAQTELAKDIAARSN